MAEISAQLVKQLREMTDAGMMDCKKALVETQGDIQKAVEFLREKGLSKAAKKADRVAAEGVISVKVKEDLSNAVMLEINSETDFVAKNEAFKSLVQKSTLCVEKEGISCTNALQDADVEGEKFCDYLHSQIAKIGENIVVRRIANIQADANGIVTGYVHSNARVGVLLSLKCQNKANAEKVSELARNICMHAAAMKPQVLCYRAFDKDFIQKEKVALKAELEKENEELKRLGKPLKVIPEFISRCELTQEVLKAQEQKLKEELKKQGKPEAIWDKILPGQMDRFIADNTLIDQRLTLMGQFFVMDDKKTIAQVLEEKSKEIGDTIEILEYIRFELGEGIEKKVEDFAAEVAAQMQ
ncbi:translation elongation factor Ts [Helicobacter mustelae]|uniref:Elongation factor Ts n=1 Tax=Helicobacter mustelae (strain ATCC 43772 / CCUG 25715 / CIP 103759 / LMG 18044 / NCTC 12198 / R85-136P) TaxID=679897 RepID=D3UGV8_HELM1|nr:translation elongation factor Ts [Helicobacter mustelae]CBG39730.1 elongation factor TS [Helicobacter mustelae 12198]SQH71236.1 elongation factor TS [Helicobacter mustelae]STP12363.1 elongation factor TS [Helicobacter mustelae]